MIGSGDGWRASGDGTFSITLPPGGGESGNAKSKSGGSANRNSSSSQNSQNDHDYIELKTVEVHQKIHTKNKVSRPTVALTEGQIYLLKIMGAPLSGKNSIFGRDVSVKSTKPVSEDNTSIGTPKKTGELFNVNDAENALRYIYDNYGRDMAATIERMYRDETGHFKSGQYKHTGTGGMEAGKWNMDLFKEHPEYAPVGTWSAYENKGSSGLGGNTQVKDRPKVFLVFPSVNAAMIYKAEYIKRHDGNFARWHSTDKATQEFYRNKLLKIKTP